jgi:hypothetical protein
LAAETPIATSESRSYDGHSDLRYPSDLASADWNPVRPHLRSNTRAVSDLQLRCEIFHANLSVVSAGCERRALPGLLRRYDAGLGRARGASA